MYKRASSFQKWSSFLGKEEQVRKRKSSQEEKKKFSQNKNSLKYKLYERMQQKVLINMHWEDLRIEGIYLGKIIKEIKSIYASEENVKKRIKKYVQEETGKTLEQLAHFHVAVFQFLEMEKTINKINEGIERNKETKENNIKKLNSEQKEEFISQMKERYGQGWRTILKKQGLL